MERSAEANGTDQPGAALLIARLEGVEGGHGHWRARCPLPDHPDTEPSLAIDYSVSRLDGMWRLLVTCTCTRAPLPAVCAVVGLTVSQVLTGNEVYRQQKPTRRRALTQRHVDACVENLHSTPSAVGYLVHERHLSPDTIAAHQLGLEPSGRYTLPVYVKDELVNVRRYLPHAEADRKMLNTTGYGRPARLYPALLPSGPVVVCEGEWDALVLGQHLPYSVVTSTHGAGVFLDEWLPLFSDRDVALVFDCDRAGRSAAQEHAERLTSFAKSVRVVDLDPDRDDKWDVTNWFRAGRPPGDLRGLIRATAPLGVR